MNPSRLFILRPVATTLLMAAILLSGLFAYRFLALSALPEVDYPTIQVQTFYPGASPEVMTSAVTAPLERQFGEMPGLSQMTSASSAGASIITMQFSLSLSIDVAEQEVQAAINAAQSLLPSDLPTPPVYAKINPADAPIMTLAISSDTMKLIDLEDIAETRLGQKISQQNGVGLVSVSGGHRPAIRVQVDPQKLAAYGINLDDIRTTIGNLNVNTPKGNFDGPAQASTINANDQITDPAQFKDAIVAYRNGNPVRLSSIATAINGPENDKIAAWANRTPAIVLNIQRQPGANVIAVVDAIKTLLPKLEASLPAAVHIDVMSDRTTTIRASISDVEFELGLAIVPGRARDLRLPAQRARDPDPKLVGPALARRHAGRHVPARLQPRQPVAHGADRLDRLRGRRRDRHDREHRPLHRGRRGAAGGGAQGFGADRLHHHLADGVADRRADPAALHGRHRRPLVPRIRDRSRWRSPS